MGIHKEYPRMPRIELQRGGALGLSLEEALEKRRSQRSRRGKEVPSLEDIGAMFWHSLRVRESGGRPYPSGGALYPVETYLIARDVSDLKSGIYHYHPSAHALEHLWDIPAGQFYLHSINAPWAEDAPAIILLTSVWERTARKYGDYSYLLALAEAGHLAQNLVLTATARELHSCTTGGFDDDVAMSFLNFTDHEEEPIYAIVLQ